MGQVRLGCIAYFYLKLKPDADSRLVRETHKTLLSRIGEVRETRWQASGTRLDNLLHYGQLLKGRGNNYFAQIANTF